MSARTILADIYAAREAIAGMAITTPLFSWK